MPSTVTIEDLEFTRFVQASFRIRGGGLLIYLDPHRITEQETGGEKADLVFITHPHGDHFDQDALRVVRGPDTVVVANAPCAQAVQDQTSVVSVKEGDTTTQKGVSIKAVPGYNGFHNRSQGVNVGYVFTVAGKTLYHGGDTDRVPEMAQMGSIDIAMVPIWGTYTMDEAEAAEAIKQDIKPRVVIPMHYGYATGGDPERFSSLVGDAAQVHILEPVLAVRMGG